MFAMMHLRNFCQVSIEKMWQVMMGLAVKSSALDRNSEGRRLKMVANGVTHPCGKFLAMPEKLDKMSNF